jgi:hypothetical protein
MFRKQFLAAVLLALILFSPSSAAAQDAPAEEEAVQAYVYLTRPNPQIVLTQDAGVSASNTYITSSDTGAESRARPFSRLRDAVKACAGKIRAMFSVSGWL